MCSGQPAPCSTRSRCARHAQCHCPPGDVANVANQVSPQPRRRVALRDLLQLESAAGVLLLALALVACVFPGKPTSCSGRIRAPVGAKRNDGLMAVFLFLIGLEVKREFLERELSSHSQIALPAMGALGGMLVPATTSPEITARKPSIRSPRRSGDSSTMHSPSPRTQVSTLAAAT